MDDELKEALITYFATPFKSVEYFNLTHESDLMLNEVFVYTTRIFENQEEVYSQSVNFAKHLYNCSIHPQIKGDEFYTVYFENCEFDGKQVDAIGLFKSERKDTFLKVDPNDDSLSIATATGININKLDKDCLIFNTEMENGYVVTVIDNACKGQEAAYWMDDFLHVLQR